MFILMEGCGVPGTKRFTLTKNTQMKTGSSRKGTVTVHENTPSAWMISCTPTMQMVGALHSIDLTVITDEIISVGMSMLITLQR